MEIASSSSNLQRKYDVLIHFDGEDIRRKFVSHLDFTLSAVGLTTFLHQENAVKGMKIQEPILDFCRVAIVVFTKTYSESAWCLHQLQQIIQWHETYSRHVLPVYYEIQPSDVRLQKGHFGKAFKATAHQTFSGQQLEHGMCRWSRALTKVANFFGWDDSNYRSDAELVDRIVKSVLNLPILSATEFPVGLESQVKDVIRTIKSNPRKVCIIGIWGMRGSGKTTLAKAIYNQIHGTFTEKSFIENISDFSQRRHLNLQKRLLSDILKTKINIHSVEMGRSMIRERLYGKRVLIVLDDMIDEHYPLLDLRICRASLGEGSVIILTTRYEDIQRKHEVDAVFQKNLLNSYESLELFSWHAFREAKPKEEYHFLAKRVVAYCKGIPLSLEVIGSYLYERTKIEWHRVLLKLIKVPQFEILPILKISFDGLRDQTEKDLFLDICCFFVGKGRAYVTKILNGCGIEADCGIRVLLERSLIKVKRNNKFGIHPLVRDMGREIIDDISRKEPRKNRWLWLDDDMKHAPSKYTTGYSKYLSKKLRCISLQCFSSEYLYNDFYLNDAIVVDLKHSLLGIIWKQPQVLAFLKVLNLSHSKYLRKTPDFSGLQNLEHLILKDCPRLREVHRSIGCLCNLTLLNLKDCTSLSNLPREIYMLKSLKSLILYGCSKINLLEKDIVQMESLITLIAENTVVKQVPFSIVSSKGIGYISLRGFEGLSNNLFPFIIQSWMSPSMNSLSYNPSFCMDMEVNSWDDITPLLSSLGNLRSVLVQCDTEFQLSKQVKTILVEYRGNITETGTSKPHFRYSFTGVGSCKEFFDAFSDSTSEGLASSESCDVFLPGGNDPYWLVHMGEGHSVSFTLPKDHVLKGMALCVIYSPIPEILTTECLRSVLIVNYTKCTLQIYNHGTVISFNDIDWQGIISNLGSGDRVEIFVIFCDGLVIKRTVVYLICGESNDLEKELVRFVQKIVM